MEEKGAGVISYPDVDHLLGVYVPRMKLIKRRTPVDMQLFQRAMRHRSYASNHSLMGNYERLEYLGDAVYHAIISNYIWNRYEDQKAGIMTDIRIKMECSQTMASLTEDLHLDDFVKSREEITPDVLEDVYEAFIGAFYLNFGFEITKEFVIAVIEKHIDIPALISKEKNYKGVVVRYYHRKGWSDPRYEISVRHHEGRRMIYAELSDNKDRVIGRGLGTTEKRAEQAASKSALKKLGILENGEIISGWEDTIEKVKKIKVPTKDTSEMLAIFNPENTLINLTAVRTILKNYGLRLGRESGIEIKLYREASTHSSYVNRKDISKEERAASKGCVPLQRNSNERLQFLGDAFNRLFLSEHLYENYPDSQEGELSTLRARLESRTVLAKLAEVTEIDVFLLVGSVVEKIHGRTPAVKAGAYEAFLGALYLNLGYDHCRMFATSVIKNEIDFEEIERENLNYKDLVREWCRRYDQGNVTYQLIKKTGPDHALRFKYGLNIRGELAAIGNGSTKKMAEQDASKKFWLKNCQE